MYHRLRRGLQVALGDTQLIYGLGQQAALPDAEDESNNEGTVTGLTISSKKDSRVLRY